MENDIQILERKTPAILMNQTEISIMIPECCREGWESCIHRVKKQKKIKTNIGL